MDVDPLLVLTMVVLVGCAILGLALLDGWRR
jgi:hypothetical protein